MASDGTPHSPISIERDGTILSAVRTGIKANSFTIRQLSARKRQNGRVVRGRTIEEWQPRGLIERDGEIYVIGPNLDGVSLDEALVDESRDRLRDVQRIADALSVQDSVDEMVLHTRAFILLEDGAVFMLPAEITRSIIENAGIPEQLRIRNRFVHPDRSVGDNLPFFVASLAYFVLTGQVAFPAETVEDVNGRIRAEKPIPPWTRRPELRRDMSEALESTLSGTAVSENVAEWAARLDRWCGEDQAVDLSEAEKEERAAEAKAEIDRIERSFGRSETIRRNWRRWVLFAVIAIVVLSVPATILRNALRPRLTAGLSPAEVVQAFYWSINSLDHMTMEDAVVDGAGKALVREVTNLFVIDRQRMSVEMRSGFVDAREWQAEGRPDLPDGISPYGLTSLSLEPLPAPDGEYAFSVTYERWLPNTSETIDKPPDPLYQGYVVTDEVKLRQDRKDWVIYEMNTVSRIEIN